MTMDLFDQPDIDLSNPPKVMPKGWVNPANYFNTVSESGPKLKEYTAKAANQNARVLDILRSLGSASPSQVWIAMGRTCPLTSVRRALTTLTDGGIAVKTDARHVGEYGRDEHVWTLPKEQAA